MRPAHGWWRRYASGRSSSRRRCASTACRVTTGVWELTWAPDGRATFSYGPEVRPSEQHVMWRRIGDHSILSDP